MKYSKALLKIGISILSTFEEISIAINILLLDIYLHNVSLSTLSIPS